MPRNTLLYKTLGIILAAVMLSSVLTAAVFNYRGSQALAEIKAGELAPRVKYLAEVTSEYLRGLMSNHNYKRTIGSGHRIWDAAMYAYNEAGILFAYPARSDHDSNTEAIGSYIDRVLQGESIYSANLHRNHSGVIVGEPVIDPESGEVIGAVFLLKPMIEMHAAAGSLLSTLLISMIVSIMVMIVPAYIGSHNIIQPIREMNNAATAMANGDFTVRANIKGGDEVAQLGRSLNHLAEALSSTINDLVREKNRLHAVINGLGEGIVAIDERGNVTKANGAALRLLGGREDEDITAIAAFIDCRNEIISVLHNGGHAQREAEVRGRRLKFTVTALGSESDCQGAVILIQDVTEAHRLEQTRVEYVANVSHELRTPIASIRGLADALNDGLIKKDEDKARYYGYILHESIRLSRLIDDLLELSRLQSGAVALRSRKMQILELICDLKDRFENAAQEKGLSITADVEQSCNTAYANPDRVEQVLVILIDNAVQHCAGSGEIALKVEPYLDRLKVSVSNPGSIPDESIDHLFDRFYKVDRSHSGKGTGLGLSIAREVLKLMGEDIWAESRDDKVTFSFTLSRYIQ